tara:strand:+ start:46 stop:237 length:192 start_codon:yes stop_codon:yes gene_type:complete
MSSIESDLSLQDLHQIKRIIEVVCSRGAIQAHEMESVGHVYNKLHTIFEKIQETKKEDLTTSP